MRLITTLVITTAAFAAFAPAAGAAITSPPDWGQPGAHERALVTVATALGALVMARAVDDPKFASAVRDAALKHLIPTG